MFKVKIILDLMLMFCIILICSPLFSYTQITLKFIKEQEKAIISTVFSPDSKNIACLTANKTIKIYDTQTGELIKVIDDKGEGEICINYSPDGKNIISGCWDKNLKIWDVDKGILIRRMYGHLQAARSVSYNNDGQFIASAGWDDVIKIWYAPTGVNLRNFKGHTQCIRSIKFSPDGNRIASSGYDLELKVWNISDGELVFSKKVADFPVEAISYSPDGKYIATAGLENSIKIWNAENGNLIKVLKGHTNAVYSISFSPDGKYLVSGSDDKIVKIWKIELGISIFDLKGHKLGIRTVNFSPDGKFIVSGAIDKEMRVWDASFLSIVPIVNIPTNTNKLQSERIISWESPENNPTISFTRHINVTAQINNPLFKSIQFFLNKAEYKKLENNNIEVVKPMSVKVTQNNVTEVTYDVYLDINENEIQLFAESLDHTSYVFSKPLFVKYIDISEQLKSTQLKVLIISPEKYYDKKINSKFEYANISKFKGIIKTQEGKLYNSVNIVTPNFSEDNLINIADSVASTCSKQDVYMLLISGFFVKDNTNSVYFVMPNANAKNFETEIISLEKLCNSISKTPAFGGIIIDESHVCQNIPKNFLQADNNDINKTIEKSLSGKKEYVKYLINSSESLQIFDILTNSLHPLNDIDNNNVIDFEEINTFFKKLYSVEYQYKGRYFPFFLHNSAN